MRRKEKGPVLEKQDRLKIDNDNQFIITLYHPETNWRFVLPLELALVNS